MSKKKTTKKKLSATKPNKKSSAEAAVPSSAEISAGLGGEADELKKLWIQMPKSKIAQAKLAAYQRDKSVSKLVEEVFDAWLQENT